MIRAALAVAFAALLAACAQVGNDSSASAGATDAKAQDARLLREIAQANMAEIATGKLAAKKGRSPLVRQFGEQMVIDHTELLAANREFAAAKRLPMPGSADLKHQAAAKTLESQSGDDFDRTYMEQMVADHTSALQLLQNAVDVAKDAELRAHAQKAQPVIQGHLDAAKRITAELIGKSS